MSHNGRKVCVLTTFFTRIIYLEIPTKYKQWSHQKMDSLTEQNKKGTSMVVILIFLQICNASFNFLFQQCTNIFDMRPTLKVQEGWPSLFWESQFTGGHFVHSPLHINCARRRQGLKNQWVIFSGMSGNESLLENDCVWTSRV